MRLAPWEVANMEPQLPQKRASGGFCLPQCVHIMIWPMRLCQDDEQQEESPQVGSFLPVKAARIIAPAHPTPLSTVIASVGQLR